MSGDGNSSNSFVMPKKDVQSFWSNAPVNPGAIPNLPLFTSTIEKVSPEYCNRTNETLQNDGNYLKRMRVLNTKAKDINSFWDEQDDVDELDFTRCLLNTGNEGGDHNQSSGQPASLNDFIHPISPHESDRASSHPESYDAEILGGDTGPESYSDSSNDILHDEQASASDLLSIFSQNVLMMQLLQAIERDLLGNSSASVARTNDPFSSLARSWLEFFKAFAGSVDKSDSKKPSKANLSVPKKSDNDKEDEEEELRRKRLRETVDEYFHKNGDTQHQKSIFSIEGQLSMNRKNHDYYNYLCNGILRALKNQGSFSSDCGANSAHNPTQNSGICRVLKSNLYYQYSPGPEIYSRKVFVGGLPIDIDEKELTETFNRYGALTVDWPNKGENKSYCPPKGYVFLIFERESSVRALVDACFVDDEKLFLYISSSLSPDKLVQIRPWRLADADYVVEATMPLYTRRAVFVGGVPRPIKAVELAHIMDRLYGNVGCAGIDTDVEYKYPKGAGRIAFTNVNSYMKAITDRYVHLSHGEVEKRVELKPYVLDDQPCDECGGERCGHRHAPFFCPQLSCLQYYCEQCWTMIHGCRARDDHKPLVKEA